MTTQIASRSRLLHSLHPLHVLIYIDCFTVPTVSQSQPSARILILAAESISAFNVALVYIYGWAKSQPTREGVTWVKFSLTDRHLSHLKLENRSWWWCSLLLQILSHLRMDGEYIEFQTYLMAMAWAQTASVDDKITGKRGFGLGHICMHTRSKMHTHL